MQVSEQTFMSRYIPISLLALTAHAMYYREGDYANRSPLSTEQIRMSLMLDSKEQVWHLLDIADEMLGNGATERRLRL